MTGTPHRVSDVMTHTVVAVGPDASFKHLVETMHQWAVSAVPVVVGEGRVIGVVSEGDMLPKEEVRNGDSGIFERPGRSGGLRKAAAVTARELMTEPAICVHADATLAEAARIMDRERVRRLPVIDSSDLLAGVVSRRDLLKVFLRPDEDIAREVREDVVDRLFPRERPPVDVRVTGGVVTLSGRVHDASLIPTASERTRAVEGVVDVTTDLTAPPAAGPTPTTDEPGPPEPMP